MSLGDSNGKASSSLRERAEAALAYIAKDLKQMSEQDIQRLVHDLQVHQVELQMQNEELRETQLQLAQSCDLYADLYDFAPVGYLTLRPDLTIDRANLSASALLGVERRLLLGRPLSNFIAPESQDTLYQHHRAVLESSEKQTCVLIVRRPEAPPIYVQLETICLQDTVLNNQRYRCILSDITSQKEAEGKIHLLNTQLQKQVSERTAELHVSEGRFHSIYQHTGMGIAIADEQGQVLQCNPSFSRIIGYSEEELRTMQIPSLIYHEDRQQNMELLWRLQRKEVASYEIENRYIRKNGRPIWVHKVVSSLPAEKGEKPLIIVLVTDISQRRQAQEELRHSEMDLSVFFSNAPIGLIWVEADGRISRVNQEQLELLGLSSEEVLSHHIDEFDIDGELATVQAALARGETIRDYRTRLPRKDDSPAHVLIDAVAIIEEGRLLRTDWFIRNISRRIELEREMLEVGERERQKVGRELHDDLGQILHGVHFISAELQVRMKEKGLAEANELEQVVHYLDEALATTRSLAHGLQPVSNHPEGLCDALREHAARIRKLYGVNCRFICPEPVKIADPKVATHLFRIAQEAANNAIKHAKCSQIIIQLKAANGRIILGVRDDGNGQSPQSGFSKGIGIHVMRFRATAIEGSLAVQRSPNEGTEVVCTLPFPDPPAIS